MKYFSRYLKFKTIAILFVVFAINGCSYNKIKQKVVDTNYITNKKDKAQRFYVNQETKIDHGVITVKPIITGVFPRYKVEKIHEIQNEKKVSSTKMVSTLTYAALTNGLSLVFWNNKCSEHQVTCTEKLVGTKTKETRSGKARETISILPNEVTVTFITDDGYSLTIPANKEGIVTTNLLELNHPKAFDVIVSYKEKENEKTFDVESIYTKTVSNRITLSNESPELNNNYKNKTSTPFKHINERMSEYLHTYISSVSMPYIPPAPTLKKIPEPQLPASPTLVKSQFETKNEFQKRVKNALNARKKVIANIQIKYSQDVDNRNKRLKTLLEEHNKYLVQISSQYTNRLAKLKAGLANEQKMLLNVAMKEVLGEPVLENLQYDAETQTAYADLSMNNAEFKRGIQWSISPKDAKNLFLNPTIAKIDAEFQVTQTSQVFTSPPTQQERIVLNKVNISTTQRHLQKNTFNVALNNNKYKVDDVRVVLSTLSPNWKNITKEAEKIAIVDINKQWQKHEIIDKHQISAITYVNNIETSIGTKAFNDDIPSLLAKSKTSKINPKRWLIVIGIENYQFTDKVSFAKRSAELFVQVVQKKLGVKPVNTLALIDQQATAGALKDTLRLFLANIPKNDEVLFYYSGHGISNPQEQNEPYILPIDKIPGYVAEDKSLKLANLYQQLSNSEAKNIIAFIDSCFSGATDGKSILNGVASARLVPKQIDFNQRKMTILTAGRNNQFSNAIKSKGNRLFSYYIMKELLKDKKDITTLYQRVAVNVREESKKLGLLHKQDPLLKGYINYSL